MPSSNRNEVEIIINVHTIDGSVEHRNKLALLQPINSNVINQHERYLTSVATNMIKEIIQQMRANEATNTEPDNITTKNLDDYKPE